MHMKILFWAKRVKNRGTIDSNYEIKEQEHIASYITKQYYWNYIKILLFNKYFMVYVQNYLQKLQHFFVFRTKNKFLVLVNLKYVCVIYILSFSNNYIIPKTINFESASVTVEIEKS